MPRSQQAFDYIIVGAGSAGCTLANRLTADGRTRVLLLEAGGWDRHPFVKLPLGWGKVLLNRMYDWGYDAEPEATMGGPPHRSRARQGRRRIVVHQCDGLCAGQSRRLRPLGVARPAGWSYEKVLSVFSPAGELGGRRDAYRGGDGPMATRKSRYQDPLVDAYL